MLSKPLPDPQTGLLLSHNSALPRLPSSACTCVHGCDFRLVSSATLRNSEIEICHGHSSTMAPITYIFSHHFFVAKLKSQLSETSNKSRKTRVFYLRIHPTELYSTLLSIIKYLFKGIVFHLPIIICCLNLFLKFSITCKSLSHL